MGVPLYQVDAFTDRAFRGNPAAVCLLDEARDAAWMQAVALEMNLSETAFLVRRDDGSYDLRWFTPAAEVDLCGHATLGCAHTLWETGALAPGETARFHTRSGELTARRDGEWIEMDFPAERVSPIEPPPGLGDALGATAAGVAANRMDYLVDFESPAELRALRPDMGGLSALSDVRGVIVTSPSDDDRYDFLSRYFAPRYGIPEDPVTGSAHCALGPFWGARLGRDTLTGYQASPRGGVVRVTIAGDRVKLGGRAVTVMHATLL